MGAWSLLTPDDTTSLASSIPSLIRSCKVDIIERLQCTNADGFDEHDVYGTSVAGRHISSRTGFVKVHTDEAAFLTYQTSSTPRDGTLQFLEDTDSLFTLVDGEEQLITTLNHSQLTGLDGDDHTQYLLADGTRAVTCASDPFTIRGTIAVNNTLATGDTHPVSMTHTFDSWHEAHGDNSVSGSLFTDASIAASAVFTTTSLTTIIDSWSFLPHSIFGTFANTAVELGFDGTSTLMRGWAGVSLLAQPVVPKVYTPSRLL